jgi:RNA polymerase sigma factor (sigma-70 family)
MTDEELIEKYDLMIRKIVNKYYTKTLDKEDLYQEGAIGLLEASKRFDKTRGIQFGTYAYYWIRRDIVLAIINNNNLIRIPADMFYKIRRLITDTIKAGEKMGIRQQQLMDKALNCRKILNIDDHDEGYKDDVKEMHDKIDANMIYTVLNNIKEKDRDKEIFLLYYKSGLNMRMIAERFNITKQRVEQIIRKVEEKIKKNLSC